MTEKKWSKWLGLEVDENGNALCTFRVEICPECGLGVREGGGCPCLSRPKPTGPDPETYPFRLIWVHISLWTPTPGTYLVAHTIAGGARCCRIVTWTEEQGWWDAAFAHRIVAVASLTGTVPSAWWPDED